MAGAAACSRRLGLIVAVIAAATLPVACVDSVSQKDFVARADARCREFRRQADGLLEPQRATGLPAPRNLRRLHALMHDTTAGLRKLEPPLGDAEQIARYLDAVDINAGYIGRLAVAVRRNQRRRIDSLTDSLGQGTATTRDLAQQYGFKVCGAD